MEQSKFSLVEWLASIFRNRTPDGEPITVSRVDHAEVVVVEAGSSIDHAEKKREPMLVSSDSRKMEFRMYQNSILAAFDPVGSGSVVFVCASDEAIGSAVKTVRLAVEEEAKTAIVSNLERYLVGCWKATHWNFWRHHMPEEHRPSMLHPLRDVEDVRSALESGVATEEVFDLFPRAVSLALRKLLFNKEKKSRMAFFTNAQRAYFQTKADAAKPYQETRIRALERTGFFKKEEAEEIVRIASPDLAMESATWAIGAANRVQNSAILHAVLTIACENCHGRDWVEDELRKLKLAPPRARNEKEFVRVLKGARIALQTEKLSKIS